MIEKFKFPKNFLWGTATSSYQVEGGIENSDWSKDFPAGKAADHYNRYEQDFDLIEKLNQNAYRFSIEWSRIEPEEGKFDEKEIEHYKKFLESLEKRKIKTMVTLHHYTNPLWFSQKKGWANSRNIYFFIRFAERMIKEYGNLVDFWVTINEPMTYASKGFLEGSRPPYKKNIISFIKVVKNQIEAHKKIFKSFHKTNNNVKVGIAKEMNFFDPVNKNSLFDKISVFLANSFWNEYFLEKIENHLDFVGLNYYFHNKIKFPYSEKKDKKNVSDLGWGIYPEGINHLLLELGGYNLPIYITENGLADREDKNRKEFIKNHLICISKAIKEGVDVRGYFHWSLMDNFEWEKGFDPKFGLLKINYEDLSRTIRPSAFYYSEICKNNYIDNE